MYHVEEISTEVSQQAKTCTFSYYHSKPAVWTANCKAN